MYQGEGKHRHVRHVSNVRKENKVEKIITPSRTNSRDSLFGERIEEDQPELSTFFYAERNPADQAPPHPYQLFSLNDFQPPSPLELPTNPVGPITMTSYINPAPQNGAHTKEYGLNKLTPFSGNRMKVKVFLQECLVYVTDKLKIGFVLSYMNEKAGLPHLWHLPDRSVQSVLICRSSPRCNLQIGEPETRKENGRTGHHRTQATDQTSQTNDEVNIWQHPLDRAIQKSPFIPLPTRSCLGRWWYQGQSTIGLKRQSNLTWTGEK